jgi:hypothetical protein
MILLDSLFRVVAVWNFDGSGQDLDWFYQVSMMLTSAISLMCPCITFIFFPHLVWCL